MQTYLSFLNAWARFINVGSHISVKFESRRDKVFLKHEIDFLYLRQKLKSASIWYKEWEKNWQMWLPYKKYLTMRIIQSGKIFILLRMISYNTKFIVNKWIRWADGFCLHKELRRKYIQNLCIKRAGRKEKCQLLKPRGTSRCSSKEKQIE